MLKEKYSIKSIWSKICVLHLRTKEHIYLNQLEDDASDDNMDILFTFLSNISNICGDILDSSVPKGNEKLRQQVERLLLQCMLDVQATQLAKFTKHYCESYISWCDCPDKFPHLDSLFIGFHEVLSSSPVRLEKVFIGALVPATKEYLMGILNEYHNEYQLQVLDKLMSRAAEIVEGRVLPLLFPKTICRFTLLPENIVYQVYFDTRMPFIFEIIMEYPDSLPALQDIGRCLLVLNTRVEFYAELSKAIKERLLHPAVETSNLINAYICVIKSLTIIDSRFLNENVLVPSIKRKLRKRGDLIQAIVDKVLSIDNDAEDSLNILTAREVHAQKLIGTLKEKNDDFFNKLDCTQKKQDNLSLLLSIHSNIDLFISEYKAMLSKRLLNNMNFDVEKELRNLETLKFRLGSNNLHHCDVMLKDIRESKRITKTIQDKITKYNIPTNFDVNPYIISANYWPKMTDNYIKLPETLMAEFEIYSKLYSEHKGNRELKWHHGLATVDIEITLNDENVRMEVTSLQAAVIHCFSEKPRWELHEMSKFLIAKVRSVRSSIHLWIKEGFLKQVDEKGTTEQYMVAEDGPDKSFDNKKNQAGYSNEQDDEDVEKDGEGDAEFYEDLWVTVSWILRLASDKKKTIDFEEIMASIPMFLMDDTVDVTKEHLETLLDKKLAENAITIFQKHYELKKSG